MRVLATGIVFQHASFQPFTAGYHAWNRSVISALIGSFCLSSCTIIPKRFKLAFNVLLAFSVFVSVVNARKCLARWIRLLLAVSEPLRFRVTLKSVIVNPFTVTPSVMSIHLHVMDCSNFTDCETWVVFSRTCLVGEKKETSLLLKKISVGGGMHPS